LKISSREQELSILKLLNLWMELTLLTDTMLIMEKVLVVGKQQDTLEKSLKKTSEKKKLLNLKDQECQVVAVKTKIKD